MILFLEIFIFIILLNFEVLRKITFMILVFYFLLVLERQVLNRSAKI